VPLRALANEPHIMFARKMGPRLFDAVLTACREAGFNMQIAHEVDNLYTACALVAAGLGVCFVPAGIQEKHSNAVVLRPVTPTLPTWSPSWRLPTSRSRASWFPCSWTSSGKLLVAKRARSRSPRRPRDAARMAASA
jgi:DNA-binding transcriptional LysR family regulator